MSSNPAARDSAGGGLDSRIWKSDTGTIHVGVVTFWEESGGARLNGVRDTFICGLLMHEQPGLISLQRSQEPGSERSQADGKMFLFSSLKLFIKGSLLPRVARLQAEVGESTLRFVKKRLWSLNGDIPLFLLHFLSPFLAIPRRRFRRPSGLTARAILTRVDRTDDGRDRRGGRESGRNCVNYPLISATDPWITPCHECWSLSRLLNDVFEMAQPGSEYGRARQREKSVAFHAPRDALPSREIRASE